MQASELARAIESQVAPAILRFVEQRSAVIETPLLSLPGKMAYGNYCVAHALPGAVETLEGLLPAEQAGGRLKVPGVPVALGLSGYVWAYLLGRLQRYLDGGWPDKVLDLEDGTEAGRTLGWWVRMMRVYRNDGELVPGVKGSPNMRVLTPRWVERLSEAALRRGRPGDLGALRKTLAMLDAFSFSIHAEARDGLFNHGPYPLGEGRVLVVKEITDLRNRFLPWVGPDRWLEVSKVVVPFVVQEAQFTYDMMGTQYSEPRDFSASIVACEVLATDGLEPMALDALQALAQQAKRVQREVFREIAGWNARWKIEHAAWQYANNFVQLFEVAGAGDETIRRCLFEPFATAGKEHVERLLEGRQPAVWEYLGRGREPLFPVLQT